MDFDLLEEVATEIGTPFYLYDPQPVRRSLENLREALEDWGEAQISYSVKTNPLTALLKEVREAGAWAEVVSSPELDHALVAGFQPHEIVFNGPLKAAGVGPEVLGLAGINIDGLEEIDVLGGVARQEGQVLHVGLRVCTPLSSPTWSRFGLNIEAGEFSRAVHEISSHPHLELSGLQVHLGTQVNDERLYVRAVRLLRELWQDSGIARDGWLDLGGGFPLDHADSPSESTISRDFVRRLVDAWGPDRPRLWIEPGRIIAGPSLRLVTRVIARKKRPREPDIIVVDSGTNHNVMAAFYEHSWSFAQTSASSESYRVCGPLCMEDDILSGEREGPPPQVGSLALVDNAGAYSLSLSRCFIQERAPVVSINDGVWQIVLPRQALSVFSNG